MKLKIKKLHADAILPKYATQGAACFDLHAIFDHPKEDGFIVINGLSGTFRTGLAFDIPQGWVMLIFSRSGHGFKNDIRLANCVGVIDSDYRGEVHVKLTSDNNVGEMFRVHHGDRIAQAMLVQIPQVELLEVDELTDTARGAGGFGSTGK